MKKNKPHKGPIYDLIRSGDFTVYWHDNGCSVLYKGKWTQEQIEDENFKEKSIIEIDSSLGFNGYTEPLAEILLDALGANHSSI